MKIVCSPLCSVDFGHAADCPHAMAETLPAGRERIVNANHDGPQSIGDDADDDLPPDEYVHLVLVRHADSEHWSPYSAHDTPEAAAESAKTQNGRVFVVPIYGINGPVLRRTAWPRSGR